MVGDDGCESVWCELWSMDSILMLMRVEWWCVDDDGRCELL